MTDAGTDDGTFETDTTTIVVDGIVITGYVDGNNVPGTNAGDVGNKLGDGNVNVNND